MEDMGSSNEMQDHDPQDQEWLWNIQERKLPLDEANYKLCCIPW